MRAEDDRLLQPVHHAGKLPHLHPRISRITGIMPEDLEDAPGFAEGFARFVAWCGEDFVLTTWGNDDISVLHQNIAFYVKGHPIPGL